MPCHTRMKTIFLRGLLWLYLLELGFMLVSTEPGYLDFDNLPDTNFSCAWRIVGGYYADVEAACQMFHVCTLGQNNETMDIRFLCLNGTVFDQSTRVCERIDEVDCEKSEQYYDNNRELYGNSAPLIIPGDSEATSPATTTTTTTSTTTTRPLYYSTPTRRENRPHYYTTTASTTPPPSRKLSLHHHQFSSDSAPDFRFNPKEINLKLNPDSSPDIKPVSYQQQRFNDDKNQHVIVTTHAYKDEQKNKKPVEYEFDYQDDKNYQNYQTTGEEDDYDDYKSTQYQTTPRKVVLRPETSTFKSASSSSTAQSYHFQRSDRPPVNPPLIYSSLSSPAPFTHSSGNKRHSDPKIKKSISVSISDQNGKELAKLNNTPISAIFDSYLDYSEEDVTLLPLFEDVPKLQPTGQRHKRNSEPKSEDVIMTDREAADVLRFLLTWYTNYEKTTKVTIPLAPETITEINDELSASPKENTNSNNKNSTDVENLVANASQNKPNFEEYLDEDYQNFLDNQQLNRTREKGEKNETTPVEYDYYYEEIDSNQNETEEDYTSIQQENTPIQQDHRTTQQDHTPIQQDHRIPQQDHTFIQQEHTLTQQDHSPIQNGNTPIQQDLINIQQDHAPTQQDHTPTQQDHTPTQQDDTPIQQDDTPILQDHTPIQHEHTPTQQDHSAIQKGNTPIQQDYTPIQQDYTPNQQDHRLTQQDHMPIQQDDTPTQQDPTPIQQGDTPILQDHTPIQHEHTPTQQDHSAIQKGNTPIQQDYTPNQQDHRLTQQDHMPIQQDDTPTKQDHTPTQQDPTPIQQDHTPIQQDHKPIQQDDTPNQQDHSAIQKGNTPIQQDYTPIQQDYTPNQQDHRLTQQDHMPIQQDDTPTKQDHTPTQQDPTPIQQDHKPIQQDDTPNQQDHRPTQQEVYSVVGPQTTTKLEDKFIKEGEKEENNDVNLEDNNPLYDYIDDNYEAKTYGKDRSGKIVKTDGVNIKDVIGSKDGIDSMVGIDDYVDDNYEVKSYKNQIDETKGSPGKKNDGRGAHDYKETHGGHKSHEEKGSHDGKGSYDGEDRHIGKERHVDKEGHDRKEAHDYKEGYDNKEGHDHKEGHDIKEGREAHDHKEGHDIKEGREAHDHKEGHDIKEGREARDHKEEHDHKERHNDEGTHDGKETHDDKRTQDHKQTHDDKETHDRKRIYDHTETHDDKGTHEDTETHGDKGTDNRKGTHDGKEIHADQETHDRKGTHDNQESHDRKGTHDNQESHDRKGTHDNQESHDRKGTHDNQETHAHQETHDDQEAHDGKITHDHKQSRDDKEDDQAIPKEVILSIPGKGLDDTVVHKEEIIKVEKTGHPEDVVIPKNIIGLTTIDPKDEEILEEHKPVVHASTTRIPATITTPKVPEITRNTVRRRGSHRFSVPKDLKEDIQEVRKDIKNSADLKEPDGLSTIVQKDEENLEKHKPVVYMLTDEVPTTEVLTTIPSPNLPERTRNMGRRRGHHRFSVPVDLKGDIKNSTELKEPEITTNPILTTITEVIEEEMSTTTEYNAYTNPRYTNQEYTNPEDTSPEYTTQITTEEPATTTTETHTEEFLLTTTEMPGSTVETLVTMEATTSLITEETVEDNSGTPTIPDLEGMIKDIEKNTKSVATTIVLPKNVVGLSTIYPKDDENMEDHTLTTQKIPETHKFPSRRRGSHRFGVDSKRDRTRNQVNRTRTTTEKVEASSEQLVTHPTLLKSANPTLSRNSFVPTTPLSRHVRVKFRKERINRKYMFTCLDKKINQFYSDPRDCRLFHYCSPGYTSTQVVDMKFVCDLGTYYDEESLICTREKPKRCS